MFVGGVGSKLAISLLAGLVKNTKILFAKGNNRLVHGARHLKGSGISQLEAESAISGHIQNTISNSSETGEFWGRVIVKGKTIEYRAFTKTDGSINVGTYYLK